MTKAMQYYAKPTQQENKTVAKQTRNHKRIKTKLTILSPALDFDIFTHNVLLNHWILHLVMRSSYSNIGQKLYAGKYTKSINTVGR